MSTKKKEEVAGPGPGETPETTVNVTVTSGSPVPNETLTTEVNEVNAAVVETPATPPTDLVKDAVDSAQPEANGYVLPTSAAEVSYEEELAARIAKSDFTVTVVAHSDFVKMNAKGLIDFETKKLKSGQQLAISENPDSATGTYWEAPQTA